MEQTDRSQREGEWGDGKRLTKELTSICIYAKPMDTDNSVGGEGKVEGRNAGGGGTSVIFSTIKNSPGRVPRLSPLQRSPELTAT